MRLDDRTYDTLKWLAIYVIPALTTFIGIVGISLQWEHTAVATTICGGLGSLIASCIGMSVAEYEKEKHEKYDGKNE